jgi:hypothetical protein
MLDIVNSLVKDISNTANNESGSLKDYQGKSYDAQTIINLSKQIAGSIDPNAIKGGVFNTKGESVGFNYDESTKLLGHPPTAAEQVILDMARHLSNEGVTDLNNVDASTTNRRFGSTYTGGGGTIYEIKKDADGKPVISSWSKNTSDKKTILTGLAIAATVFGIPGVTEGLLSSAPAGATLGTVGSDLAAMSGVAGETGALTAAESAALYGGGGGLTAGSTLSGLNAGTSLSGVTGGTLGATNALLSDAALGTTLAGASTLPVGTTLANLGAAGAGGSLLTAANAAKVGALGLTTADALALQTGGTLLSGAINKNAVNNASDIINKAGETGTKTLADVYTEQKDFNTANNTTLAKNYENLNTGLTNTLNNQVGAYNTANTNINANASNEQAILKNILATQTAQANANADTLNNNYGTTRNNLYDIYNQQVGIQQPYQAVGQAGSQGLLDNQGYLTHQFDVNDLNTNLAPNYAFQLAQGQMANQRAANMGGGSLGGNAMQGLQKYTQDYAGTAYQKAFENFNTQRTNIFTTLKDMAGIGTTSSGQLATLGNTFGTNLGSLSSNYGANTTTNTGNLLNSGNVYGTNTTGVSNNLNNALSTNLGQLQTGYNNYGNNLTSGSTNLSNNLTTGAGQVINAGNVYGTNQTGLTTGLAAANAQNQVAGANVVGTTLNNLGNTALLSSLIKAT